MIIDAIQLYSNSVKYAEFSLDHTDHTQRYILQDSTGLDVDEVSPTFYNYAPGSSRVKFINQVPKTRAVVLKIKLNPQYHLGETPSVLRDAMYKAVSSARTSLVELRFVNNGVVKATIPGFITKLEAPLFTASPEVKITVMCEQFFLKNPAQITATPSPTAASFTITDSVSTAPHGFKANVKLTFGDSDGIRLRDSTSTWTFDFTGALLIKDDVLWISSEEGDRYLYFIRSGVKTLLLDKVIPGSSWPLIFPGANSFVIERLSTGLVPSSVPVYWNSLTYYETFWGV